MTVLKLLTALWLCFVFAVPASAHDWYDSDCCNKKDCHPVQHDEVYEDKEGVWHYKKYTFKGEGVRASKDAFFHVCLPEYGKRCIYIIQSY